MNPSDHSIVLSFRFAGKPNRIQAFEYLSAIIESMSGKTIADLHYSILDKSKPNWQLRSKNVKYTKKNLLKFYDLVSANQEKISIDFELFRGLPNGASKTKDIDFAVLFHEADRINCLNIALNASLYMQREIMEFAAQIIQYLSLERCDICYGYVLKVKNDKRPMLYAEGIGNGNLEPAEEDKLMRWTNNKVYCRSLIWDVFWGNILSKEHLVDNQTRREIETIVGMENIKVLSPSLLWFNLDEPLTEFDIMQYSTQRRQLYDYFNSRHLLIT